MNYSRIAFLFPGQGSQSVCMGKDLAEHYPIARQTFEEADEALGMKLFQLCCEGPEDQLRLTQNTQPAILAASVAAWRVFSEQGVTPAFLAGHSLGEYSAHVAAGTISFGDAVRAVRSGADRALAPSTTRLAPAPSSRRALCTIGCRWAWRF